jgi:hypothetical protein
VVLLYLLSLTAPSFLLTELSYYSVLFAGGVAFAQWCHADAHAAPIMATLVIVIAASWHLCRFVTSPAVNSRFGPEIWIFALQQLAAQTVMLPLDVAISFSAWYVFSRRYVAGA